MLIVIRPFFEVVLKKDGFYTSYQVTGGFILFSE
jgi:hypothetical protein